MSYFPADIENIFKNIEAVVRQHDEILPEQIEALITEHLNKSTAKKQERLKNYRKLIIAKMMHLSSHMTERTSPSGVKYYATKDVIKFREHTAEKYFRESIADVDIPAKIRAIAMLMYQQYGSHHDLQSDLVFKKNGKFKWAKSLFKQLKNLEISDSDKVKYFIDMSTEFTKRSLKTAKGFPFGMQILTLCSEHYPLADTKLIARAKYELGRLYYNGGPGYAPVKKHACKLFLEALQSDCLDADDVADIYIYLGKTTSKKEDSLEYYELGLTLENISPYYQATLHFYIANIFYNPLSITKNEAAFCIKHFEEAYTITIRNNDCVKSHALDSLIALMFIQAHARNRSSSHDLTAFKKYAHQFDKLIRINHNLDRDTMHQFHEEYTAAWITAYASLVTALEGSAQHHDYRQNCQQKCQELVSLIQKRARPTESPYYHFVYNELSQAILKLSPNNPKELEKAMSYAEKALSSTNDLCAQADIRKRMVAINHQHSKHKRKKLLKPNQVRQLKAQINKHENGHDIKDLSECSCEHSHTNERRLDIEQYKHEINRLLHKKTGHINWDVTQNLPHTRFTAKRRCRNRKQAIEITDLFDKHHIKHRLVNEGDFYFIIVEDIKHLSDLRKMPDVKDNDRANVSDSCEEHVNELEQQYQEFLYFSDQLKKSELNKNDEEEIRQKLNEYSVVLKQFLDNAKLSALKDNDRANVSNSVNDDSHSVKTECLKQLKRYIQYHTESENDNWSLSINEDNFTAIYHFNNFAERKAAEELMKKLNQNIPCLRVEFKQLAAPFNPAVQVFKICGERQQLKSLTEQLDLYNLIAARHENDNPKIPDPATLSMTSSFLGNG